MTEGEAIVTAAKLSKVFAVVYIDGSGSKPRVIARGYNKDSSLDRQMAHRAKQLREAKKDAT